MNAFLLGNQSKSVRMNNDGRVNCERAEVQDGLGIHDEREREREKYLLKISFCLLTHMLTLCQVFFFSFYTLVEPYIHFFLLLVLCLSFFIPLFTLGFWSFFVSKTKKFITPDIQGSAQQRCQASVVISTVWLLI